jgi:hypothetical protein
MEYETRRDLFECGETLSLRGDRHDDGDGSDDSEKEKDTAQGFQ